MLEYFGRACLASHIHRQPQDIYCMDCNMRRARTGTIQWAEVLGYFIAPQQVSIPAQYALLEPHQIHGHACSKLACYHTCLAFSPGMHPSLSSTDRTPALLDPQPCRLCAVTPLPVPVTPAATTNCHTGACCTDTAHAMVTWSTLQPMPCGQWARDCACSRIRLRPQQAARMHTHLHMWAVLDKLAQSLL